MSTQLSLSRRRFMTGAAGLTFGVAVGAPEFLSGTASAQTAAKNVVMNAWVTLATDGRVYIMSPAAEMGQGSLTSIPLVIADEMDADWNRVTVVPAPPNDKLYGNPQFGMLQYTAGSATISGYFRPAREFGAQVRAVLLDNAARQWNVPLAECSTQPGVVLHEKSGRRLTYGEVAAFATLPKEAPAITLAPLDQANFRIVGRVVVGII